MKRLAAIWILALAWALCAVVSVASVGSADETTTTSSYSDGNIAGTTKTTTNPDTNTTTSTTTASGANGNAWVDRTIKTTTTGNPPTYRKTVTTNTYYAYDPKTNKKGAKQLTETTTQTQSNFNAAGGYTQTDDAVHQQPNGDQVIEHSETERDGGGNIISGTRTQTHIDKNGAKTVKKETFADGSWTEVALVPNSDASDSVTTVVDATPGTSGNVGDGSDVALSPFAESQIVFHVDQTQQSQDRESGAGGVLILTEDDHQQKKLHRVLPTKDGAYVLGAAFLVGLKAIDLVKEIDDRGDPVIVSSCTIGTPTHIPGTESVTNPPSTGPAITELPSSMQPGQIVKAHLARVDPRSTYMLVDGERVEPLSVSDESAALKLPPTTALGHRTVQIISAGKPGGEVHVSVVRLYAEPVPESQPGVEETVTIHVDGWQPGDRGTLYCEIGGAATMADGSTTAAVPVNDGLVHLPIRGIHSGQALLRFHLQMQSADFSQLT